MKKNIMYNIILYICFFISVIIFIILVLFSINVEKISYHIKDNRNLYELNENDFFFETFKSQVNNLDSIGIVFKYDESIKEECYVTIKLSESNNQIFLKNVSNKELNNNSFQVFEFQKIAKSLNKEYSLFINNGCNNQMSLYFYTNNKNATLKYNDNIVDYGLFFYEHGTEKSHKYLYYPLIIGIILLIIIVMKYDKKEWKYAKKNI